jgi:hypothetical protein
MGQMGNEQFGKSVMKLNYQINQFNSSVCAPSLACLRDHDAHVLIPACP